MDHFTSIYHQPKATTCPLESALGHPWTTFITLFAPLDQTRRTHALITTLRDYAYLIDHAGEAERDVLVVDAVGIALRADVVVHAYAALVADADHLLAAILASEVVDSIDVTVDFCRTICSIVPSRRVDLRLELEEVLVEFFPGTGPVEVLERVR